MGKSKVEDQQKEKEELKEIKEKKMDNKKVAAKQKNEDSKVEKSVKKSDDSKVEKNGKKNDENKVEKKKQETKKIESDKNISKPVRKKQDTKKVTKEVNQDIEIQKLNKNVPNKNPKKELVDFKRENQNKEVIKRKETINKNKIEEKQKEEDIFEQFEKTVKNKKSNAFNIFLILLIIIVLALLGISTIPSIIVRNGEKIVSGISVNGVSVEGLTFEEAQELLTIQGNDIINSDLKLTMGDYENSVNLSQISTKYDINNAIEEAHKVGRSSNIFKSSYDILRTTYKGKDIEIDVSFNEEELKNIFNNISQELPGGVVQWSYSVDNNNLFITKGTNGIVIDENGTAENIKKSLIKALKGEKIDSIELVTREVEPEAIDVDKIHEEIYREPQNAYVTQNPFGVFVHVDGIDFDVEEVKNLIASDEQEYKIALTITSPEITTKDLGKEAFPDILGKIYKTTYSAGDVNRNTNIEIAARTVNGTILMPGETFSYNGILGDTTADKGYKPAGAYLNGQTIQSYGGGVCQVSSTIYNAVLYANLEVTERYNHTYLSGYVPAGLDATISYGSKDFKFTNNREFPIKLVCTAQNGTISATIYGVKQDDDCEVELQSVVTSYIAPTVKYENTNTLNEGVEKVKQAGSSGCKCTVYRTLSRNGEQISREVLHNDVYSAKQKIILKGTKKIQNTKKTD